MGSLTRTQIISQGATLAGRTDSGVLTEAVKWLNAWLRSQYQAWPWPFLLQRRSGLALTAGVQSILVGGGNSGITEHIQAVQDSFQMRTSTYAYRGRPRLMSYESATYDFDPDMSNPVTQRGPPSFIQIRTPDSPTPGVWKMIFLPTPDLNYILNFDYKFLPADLASDSSIPLYPNDRTMVQAVTTQTLLFSNGADDPGYQQALQVLGGMVIDDRVKSGQIPGTNDVWGLDGGVFK